MTSLLTKEEQEELLNKKIEMMKKKNAELMRRHQLVEEDKRLAEQQGRSVTIRNQAPYSPMKGEILRAADEDGKRKTAQNSKNQSTKKYNGPNVKFPTGKTENSDSGPPPDPACKFLADRRREGPLPPHGKGREFSRRHPRNFGGVDFNDVPKKIHDEKEKQTHQPQIRTKADETLYTTGKERRELEEWRREREKIDRARLERQKNKEGNWRREWDRNKDELSYTDEQVDEDEPLNRRLPQPTPPRPDDRLKANGRSRHQRKREGQNESATAMEHQVNNRTLHHSNTPQHLNDDNAPRHSREKPEKLLLMEKSLLRTADKRQGDEEKRFRQVQEQNDSLIIKVKTQPSDFYRVPSNSAVNAEPVSPDSASRDHMKNGRRNFREGQPLSRLSNSSDSGWGSGKKNVPDSRRGEERAAPPRINRNNANAEKSLSSKNANRERRGEMPNAEPREFLDESSPGSPRKPQSDSKAEKPVGSGRISIHSKNRRNKNRRKSNDTISREQQLNYDAQPDSLLADVKQNRKKIPTNTECELRTGNVAVVQDKVVANQCNIKPTVSLASGQAPAYIGKNSDHPGAEGKNRGSEPVVDRHLDEGLGAKPDLLGRSFDPLEDDQFDDEEWEDIDEEVCIGLIAGGEEEESYEENPLDISDGTLDQLVSAHIIAPRGQKIVDWAAEMESSEDDRDATKRLANAGLVPRTPANESP